MHGAYIMAEQGGNMLPLTAPKVSSNKIYYQKYLPPILKKSKYIKKMLKKVLKSYLPKKKKKKKIAKSGIRTEKRGLALKSWELRICVFL